MMTTAQKGMLAAFAVIGGAIGTILSRFFRRQTSESGPPPLSVGEARAHLEESLAQARRGETKPFDFEEWDHRIADAMVAEENSKPAPRGPQRTAEAA